MAGSTGKRLTGIILFIVAAIGIASFLFLLFADAEDLDSVPGTDDVGAVAIIAAIALGVIALVLILLLLIRGYDKQESEADEAEAFFIPDDEEIIDFAEVDDEEEVDDVEPTPAEGDGRLEREGVVPMDLSEVPLGAGAWGITAVDGQAKVHSFHYPREDGAALYNNDYITVNGEGDQLKLRTLLAAPEGAYDGLSDEPIAKKAKPAKKPAKKAAKKPAKKAAAKPKPAPAKKPAVVPYTDFKGDVDPVIDIEGIGPVYERKLAEHGVRTTARLCYEDPAKLAKKIDAPEKSVRLWRSMAELMKVHGIGGQYAEVLARAGITGIDDLKKRKSDDIANAINTFLDSLEVNVIGNKITTRRVDGWKAKAKDMRRVRQAIPEE